MVSGSIRCFGCVMPNVLLDKLADLVFALVHGKKKLSCEHARSYRCGCKLARPSRCPHNPGVRQVYAGALGEGPRGSASLGEVP